MQFATSFFVTNHPKVVENMKNLHEYVRFELGLEMDHETGKAFEKAGIIGRGTLAGSEKDIKIESVNP
jgi:hypothetical protein